MTRVSTNDGHASGVCNETWTRGLHGIYAHLCDMIYTYIYTHTPWDMDVYMYMCTYMYMDVLVVATYAQDPFHVYVCDKPSTCMLFFADIG